MRASPILLFSANATTSMGNEAPLAQREDNDLFDLNDALLYVSNLFS